MNAPGPARRGGVDALRGLMLVLMALTHLPTRLTLPLGQPFGYVSSAEGFVLLSAYMTGLTYGRLVWNNQFASMRAGCLRRALKVYLSQMALMLFLFALVAGIDDDLKQSAVTNLSSFLMQHPATAWINGLLLIYKPPLLDILPMYVLFMLATPLLLGIALRLGWMPVMGLSVLLWLASQIGWAHSAYDATAGAIPFLAPYRETGSFSVAAWQFLWVLGLWMGTLREEQQAAAFAIPPRVLKLAIGIAIAGLAWRHAIGQIPFGSQEQLNLLFDKWQLGPLRLIDLFALILVTIRFGPALEHLLPGRQWLQTIGAASLPVFNAHIVLVLLVLTFVGADYGRPWAIDLPLLAAAFGTLYAVARISLWLKQSHATGRHSNPHLPGAIYGSR